MPPKEAGAARALRLAARPSHFALGADGVRLRLSPVAGNVPGLFAVAVCTPGCRWAALKRGAGAGERASGRCNIGCGPGGAPHRMPWAVRRPGPWRGAKHAARAAPANAAS